MQQQPEFEVINMPVGLVTAIDSVDKFWQVNGSKDGYVTHKGDWKVIRYCYDLFRISYPNEVKIFIQTQKELRRDLKNEKGMIKEGDARLQHIAEIPQKLHALISVFYPKQKWDAKFVRQLCKEIPLIKVGK